MRKGLVFKKGIIFALATAVVTSLPSYAGVYTVMAENNISVQSKETEDNWLEAGDFSVLGDSSGYSFDEDNRILNVKSTATLTIKNTDSNKATTDRICVAYSDSSSDKANITLAGVNIDCTDTDQSAFTIEHNSEADVTVILADHTDNILIGGTKNAGLQKTSARKTDEVHFNDNTLRIMCEHSDEDDHICDASCGKLTAKGYGGASGIGGLYDYAAGNISISGGNIAASADFEGAGIGNGKAATNYGMTIQITGGNIAASSQFGSGIGYGYRCTWYKMNICISGGNIVATSAAKRCGEGIGGGDGKSSDHDANIKITGGSVNASSVKSQPTNEDGEKIYPLKVSNVADDVTIDDETYSSKLKDADNNLYIWLTTGEHTVNGVKANYGVSKSGKLLYAPVKDDFTYTAPIALTYDKTAKTAAVGINDDVPYTDKTMTVKYVDGEGNELTDVPVNAGTYTVKACMDEAADDHIAVEFELGSFTIKQAELDTADIIRKREIPCKDNVHVVSDVELPDGWIWNSGCENTAISAGQSVEAAAIYNGDDKANYTDESRKVIVQIIRNAHKDEDMDGKCDLEECGKLIKAPQALIVYDNNNSSSKINVITNGKLQDDGVADNEDNIYQGTNWSYDSTKNQLLLKDSSIQSIECCDGDLTVLVSGENTISRQFDFSSDDGAHTLDIYSDNKGSLTVGEGIRGDISGSGTINLNITGAVVKVSDIYCKGNLTIENSDIDCNNDGFAIEAEGNIIITNGYVKAKSDTEMDAIISSKQISVADSQIVVESGNTNAGIYILKENITNSIIKEIWQENDSTMAKTSVYGSASLKADLIIASGESIDFKNGASITNLDKLIVEDGATILIDGAEHKHNTNGNITYIWQDDKEHIKKVACKDCPIGYVTKETEAHNIGENGFCMSCDAYQPAVLTTDKYDINEDGTKDAVYEISNAGQLYWFAGLVNGTLSGVEKNTSANAVLTADIVVNANVLMSDGTLNEGTFKEWTPIGTDGTSSNVYTGTFDGRKYTISGLYFNQEAHYIGLFGANSGKIANVGILDSYFYGQPYRGNWVGGVCGYNTNQGAITNCYNTGIVRGSEAVGGVCGSNYGIITNCSNTGNVGENDDSVGGVSGNNYGTITNCNNAGIVSGNSYVGGVCGKNYNGGTVTNCNNTGEVEGTSYYIGGLSGDNDRSRITNCNNTGKVRATGNHVGGLSGGNYNNGTVTNCYYDSTIYTGAAIGDDKGTTTKVEGKTTEQYKTGEVAYLLQEGQTEEAWGQTIGTDTYPVLRGAKVYKNNVYSGCNDLSDVVSVIYSNEDKPTYGDHNFADGECGYCGEKAAATVTISETTTYYQSLQDAIDYAEKIPGCVVTAVAEMKDGKLNVDSPKADFTIDINGYVFSSGIAIKEGKITITDSRTGGDIVDEIETYDNSTLTIGDVKISGDILSLGNLILNGGDLHLIIQESRKKIYFNNSDIKISEGIRISGDVSSDVLVVNAEPHNIIPIILNEFLVNLDNTYAVAGDGVALKKDWFTISATHCELDLTADIRDNKLKAGALLNDKVKVELEKDEAITYSGSELKPSLKLSYNRYKMDPIQLTEGTDYTVTYESNINVGTATAKVTGVGSYTGTKCITFDIATRKVEDPVFDGLVKDYEYTGKAIKPEFTLKDGDRFIPQTEYEVSYGDNIEPGEGVITVADKKGGNYEVSGQVTFNIVLAVPDVLDAPQVGDITYDPSGKLENITLSGGKVVGVTGDELTGTWTWTDNDIVPTVDNKGYEAIFTPDDKAHYKTVKAMVCINVKKADISVINIPAAGAIIYGDSLEKSALTGGQACCGTDNKYTVSGAFSWKDKKQKPSVADSGKTKYMVVFTPDDTINYNTASCTVTLTVGKSVRTDVPGSSVKVPNTYKTVGRVSLPSGWSWTKADAGTVLKAGASVNATAVYTGTDSDNYDKTSVTVSIYREKCTNGGIVYTSKGEKAPTCTSAGKGHVICSVCGDTIKTGVTVKATGHKWNSCKVTKKASYKSAGIKTYTCIKCKAVKTTSIQKLKPVDISKKASKVSVTGIKNKIYNGKKQTQTGLVVKCGKVKLKKNVDYTVSYTRNIKIGKATLVIRGKNAYTGTIRKTFVIKTAKGKVYTAGNFRYKITNARTDGKGEVTLIGTTYKKNNKAFKKLTVADTVSIGGVKFRVTAIGAKAFSGYSHLKTVSITALKLKKVGTDAFRYTNSKLVFRLSKKNATSYKKLIKNGRPSKKAVYRITK